MFQQVRFMQPLLSALLLFRLLFLVQQLLGLELPLRLWILVAHGSEGWGCRLGSLEWQRRKSPSGEHRVPFKHPPNRPTIHQKLQPAGQRSGAKNGRVQGRCRWGQLDPGRASGGRTPYSGWCLSRAGLAFAASCSSSTSFIFLRVLLSFSRAAALRRSSQSRSAMLFLSK